MGKKKFNPFFGWILNDNPHFFEDNGFKVIDNKNYHYFGNNMAKANHHPVYKKQLYINHDSEDESAVVIFSVDFGCIQHEHLMAIYIWNNAGGCSCRLKRAQLVSTIEQYNEVIKEFGLDNVEDGTYLLKVNMQDNERQ